MVEKPVDLPGNFSSKPQPAANNLHAYRAQVNASPAVTCPPQTGYFLNEKYSNAAANPPPVYFQSLFTTHFVRKDPVDNASVISESPFFSDRSDLDAKRFGAESRSLCYSSSPTSSLSYTSCSSDVTSSDETYTFARFNDTHLVNKRSDFSIGDRITPRNDVFVKPISERKLIRTVPGYKPPKSLLCSVLQPNASVVVNVEEPTDDEVRSDVFDRKWKQPDIDSTPQNAFQPSYVSSNTETSSTSMSCISSYTSFRSSNADFPLYAAERSASDYVDKKRLQIPHDTQAYRCGRSLLQSSSTPMASPLTNDVIVPRPGAIETMKPAPFLISIYRAEELESQPLPAVQSPPPPNTVVTSPTSVWFEEDLDGRLNQQIQPRLKLPTQENVDTGYIFPEQDVVPEIEQFASAAVSDDYTMVSDGSSWSCTTSTTESFVGIKQFFVDDNLATPQEQRYDNLVQEQRELEGKFLQQLLRPFLSAFVTIACESIASKPHLLSPAGVFDIRSLFIMVPKLLSSLLPNVRCVPRLESNFLNR